MESRLLKDLNILEEDIDKDTNIILKDFFQPYWVHVSFIILSVIIIYKSESSRKVLKNIKDPFFLFMLFFIFCFSIWGLYYNNDNLRIRLSTEKALMALIIAYSAYLNLYFLAFIIIWIISYNTVYLV